MARRLLARTSVRDALDSAVIALTAAGCDTPRLDAELLLAHVIGVGRAAIISDPERGLEPEEARMFMDFAARRREREPVAYILGSKGFRTIELAVDARVLVPRPETEHVVEAVLDLPVRARVADVGTGSGAIALALKAERPDLDVVATELSPGALAVARANAARLGLEVELLQGDLLDPVSGPLDAVVSNPPYVATGDPLPPEVGRHEPREALFGGADGLDVIRRLIPAAAASGAGLLALEVGAGQAAAVAELMGAAGYGSVAVARDLAGIERVVVGRADSSEGPGRSAPGGAARAGEPS
jgi:release factor glutamine methyltransferase